MDERESARVEPDLNPPYATRPGTRTIVAATSEFGRWKQSRVGLDLDAIIEEELEDYRAGLEGWIAEGSGGADDYASSEADIALWEGERCLALIHPRVGGDPDVLRLDGGGDWPPPIPSTQMERIVWSLIKEFGAEVCHRAIMEKFPAIPKPVEVPPVPLSSDERLAIHILRSLGHAEGLSRLTLCGPYRVIHEAIMRLGGDAFAHLRDLARERESLAEGTPESPH